MTPLSQWIAYHLNKVIETCDTVLPSTASIVTELRTLAHPQDGDVYLVTADASDMYNNIPVDQAILAVGSLLLRRNFSPGLAAAITAALELVLNNNYFSFDGATYRQTAGIAMGTPCAPPLAQLFVAVLEEDLRASLDTRWPTLYKRYIDDSFAIFKGTRDGLDSFLAALQAMHPNLRWTSVDFLRLKWYYGTLTKICEQLGRLDQPQGSRMTTLDTSRIPDPGSRILFGLCSRLVITLADKVAAFTA